MVDDTLPKPEENAQEEWRSIPGLPTSYEVSSLGRVRSLPRSVWIDRRGSERGHWRYYTKTRIRKTFLNVRGYPTVRFCGYPNKRVHSLVAAAFIGPRPSPLHEVAHKNGKRQDNRVSNLRWSTRPENQQDRRAHGTYFMRGYLKGEQHLNAILTEADVLAIRSAYTGKPGEITAFAERYGLTYNGIDGVVRGKTWKHIADPD